MDADRVAEEGVKSARHLLGMALRALDYLPPVDLEFADVLDAVITADQRLAPDDDHHYRDALTRTFAAFGITPPPHRILDQDRLPGRRRHEPHDAAYPPDPDTDAALGVRYEHLNLVALRSSPEEVYQFIWNNAAVLGIDVRFPTRVERVLASTRVGPDGLIVNEILADYVQTLHTTADNLPPGMPAPARDGPGHGRRAVGRRGAGVRPVRPVPAAPAAAAARPRPAEPHGCGTSTTTACAALTAPSASPTALGDLRRFAQLHRGADA